MTAAPIRLRVCATGDLPDQAVLRVDLPNRPPIALFRLADGFFATDDTCTHGAASLADGFVEDGQIECPFHSGRFDIRTGEPTLHPCIVKLRTYTVIVEGDSVFVDIAEGTGA